MAGLTYRAGVLLIVPSNRDARKTDVILVGEQRGSGAGAYIEFTIPSGTMNPNEKSSVTAVRELYEETRCVINPTWIRDFARQPKVTFTTKHSSLKVYLLELRQGHYCTQYKHADMSRMPHCFRETVAMHRVPLSSLRSAIAIGTSFCTDDSGNICRIAGRAIEAVRNMDKAGILATHV